MSLKFLSDEWFTKVEELVAGAGDLDVPTALAELTLNVLVNDTEWGDVEACMENGNIVKGFKAEAPTKMILNSEMAHRLFIENDQSAGMQGFMSGQIKVEGDMSKLMTMQTAQPSEPQIALQKQIREITEL
ncbi:MAG: SCP-2 sterol transfer family protein [Moraxellaceae bacterium]|nr:MAG: SCP-2 sterol transfer family protein [Moraxellaceae bacterium]